MHDVGRIVGTQDAMPLEFWVAVSEGQYLELDDVVVTRTPLPDGREVTLYGVVDIVKARHEGTHFDSDVFLVERAVMPAGVAQTAHVAVTRIEPEIYVPPLPGRPVARATGQDRDEALFFDRMSRRFPLGLARDGQVIYGNVEFIDGTRGGHVNISGISGIATKTTYAMFLLHSLFRSGALGTAGANARAVIFNVKGEDLLWLDRRNRVLDVAEAEKYGKLGLPAEPFASVQFLAPVRRGVPVLVPDTGSRQEGVTAYCWSLEEFCRGRLLRFCFADADDEASQLGHVVARVESHLQALVKPDPITPGGVEIDNDSASSAQELAELIARKLDGWAGTAAGGTKAAFLRRLESAMDQMSHLIRPLRPEEPARHRIDWRAKQVSVIDIHNLPDRAKRFVVGAVLKRMFDDKEAQGTPAPLVFTVLDELNRYAPRNAWSPIKEVLLDIAERGRSLGIILIGAQQTASEVELRIVANSAYRIVGRLDTAEAERSEYRFLPAPSRARAGILKPGTLIVHQPELPVPLLLQFPFPSWATRASEATQGADPFRGF